MRKQYRILFSREPEFIELHADFNKIDEKIDMIIDGQNEIKLQLALNTERQRYNEQVVDNLIGRMDGFGADVEDNRNRIRDLEEHVRNNTQSRTRVQVWIERIFGATLLAYFGLDKWFD